MKNTSRLRSLLRGIGISALSFLAQADTPSIETGFPRFDAYITICSRNEPNRAAEFKQRLDPASACGQIDATRAARIRSSKPYRDALTLQVSSFPREASQAGTSEFCQTVLDNVDEFCSTDFGVRIDRRHEQIAPRTSASH